MGAWGVGSFENDAACDWMEGLHGQSNLAYVEATIDRTLSDPEAADGQEAIAATEVVARLQGHWGQRDGYSRPVDNWVAAVKLTPTPQLVGKARQVIAHVQTEPSALLRAWVTGKDPEGWKKSLADLASRLTD